VQLSETQLFVEYSIRGLHEADLLFRDVTKNAHSQTRTREWMASKDLLRNVQLSSDQTHFIFEQLAQRLDQLKIHLLRQPTDVVMTLDHRRWTTHRNGFDDIGVQRALHKIADVTKTPRLFFKDVDEHFADALALLFRIGDASQRFEKSIARANALDVQLHGLLQEGECRFKFTFTQ